MSLSSFELLTRFKSTRGRDPASKEPLLQVGCVVRAAAAFCRYCALESDHMVSATQERSFWSLGAINVLFLQQNGVCNPE